MNNKEFISRMPESEVSSLIKTIAGKIPYGDMLKAALGPMLKEMLGSVTSYS